MQILCHRPPHLSGLHVSLQVEAFGNFMNENVDIPHEYYRLAIDLMQAMSGFFTDEGKRQSKFYELIRPLIVCWP